MVLGIPSSLRGPNALGNRRQTSGTKNPRRLFGVRADLQVRLDV